MKQRVPRCSVLLDEGRCPEPASFEHESSGLPLCARCVNERFASGAGVTCDDEDNDVLVGLGSGSRFVPLGARRQRALTS